MRYYEVYIADNRYHNNSPLTYSSDMSLQIRNVVTVPLRGRMVTGFVTGEVDKPKFPTKPIKNLLSSVPLPVHCFELSKWLMRYYVTTLGEALRQFAPSRPTLRNAQKSLADAPDLPVADQLEFKSPLTKDQVSAINSIKQNPSTTVLLHGATGSGKTRVYLELAKEILASNKSVVLLTPEIALTSQLVSAANAELGKNIFVLHSRLTQAQRKRIWLSILESSEPVVVIGPRSALFSPIQNLGLIILDEAHEPAYKQDQSPRYHTGRVASQMGLLAGAKVILGTATPALTDYFVATNRNAVVEMNTRAIDGGGDDEVKYQIIDLKDKRNLTVSHYLSAPLIDSIKRALNSKKQVMLYLNRRGSARLILCSTCGWQLVCPNCDIPLVYHGDTHNVRCHICGFNQPPPSQCPECLNSDVIFKSIGTKALVEETEKFFPDYKIGRFDSDNLTGEHVSDVYAELRSGRIDILIGTQLLAKGLDLPRLGLVGIISAEDSLSLPDYTSEERAFQLLYQVMGRVGRGHINGEVVIQSYEPESMLIQTALKRDYNKFYGYLLKERQQFRFPPFSYLMQLTCRRATLKGAEKASRKLADELSQLRYPIEVVGPSPSFYARRGKYYYWQLTVKSKSREQLLRVAEHVPADWIINMDPIDLL